MTICSDVLRDSRNSMALQLRGKHFLAMRKMYKKRCNKKKSTRRKIMGS